MIKFSPTQKGLSGNITIHYFRNELLYKYADVIAQEQGAKDEGLFTSGIRLIITLQGRSELKFDTTSLQLCAEKRAQAAILPINKKIHGIKKFAKGKRQRELVIFLEPEWIQYSDFKQFSDFQQLLALQQMHLQPITLLVNKRILMLAESLIQDTESDLSVLGHIRKESECLMLISELLSQLTDFKKNIEFSVEQQRVTELTQLLQSGKADQWSLSQISRYMHTNVTTLQTQFKQVHGVSIMSYLRQLKLERAYKALLQGVSVGQAADIAGYSNPDNFTTAFRQYFDFPPSKVKKMRSQFFIG